jgi:hypothetical protein
MIKIKFHSFKRDILIAITADLIGSKKSPNIRIDFSFIANPQTVKSIRV